MKEIKLKNKKVLILGIVAIITVILLVAGSAYAFFVAQSNSGSEAKLNTTTGTTDSLTFNTTTSISINATQNNFGQNKGNLKGSTSAVATLKANSTTNQAKEKYNLFFIISTNDFVYSTGTKKAELLLKVTDPAGKEVTNITGLIKTPDGFDITTRTGGFAIVNDYEIVSTGTKIDDWKFEVTLVNLDTDQKLNESKTFSGRVFITQEPYKTYELAKINNINATKTTDSLALNADVTEGTAPVTKYYFGIEESTKPIALLSNKVRKLNNTVAALNQVSFVESITPSHKFTTLKDNTDYKIYSYAVDKEGIKSNTYETVLKTETYVLPTVTNVTDSNVTLNSITVSAVAVKGTNDIKTYYYSKDNGATYVTSTSNTYTFNNLLEGTEYKIKVKVEDTIAKFSTEFFKAITTRTYTLPSINSVTESNITSSSFNLRVNANQGTNAIRTYYYSKDNGGSYVTSSSNSYTFSGLSENTQYNVKVKVEDTNGRFSQIYTKYVSTIKATIAEACVGQNLAQCIKNNYYKENLDYHNGITNGANDYSYRYSGKYPNNYVCFGSGSTPVGQVCPNENKYRIIGVFGNQVKLIKNTPVALLKWNYNNDNTWPSSAINSYLNGEYLNSLGNQWSNKIESTSWKIGGMLTANAVLAIAPTVYQYEVGANSTGATSYTKIGLMYLSDYAYATIPTYWTKRLDYYYNPNVVATNWLFAGINERTISLVINQTSTYSIFDDGGTGGSDPQQERNHRPTFYLQSSITLAGGTGELNNPYRIN